MDTLVAAPLPLHPLAAARLLRDDIYVTRLLIENRDDPLLAERNLLANTDTYATLATVATREQWEAVGAAHRVIDNAFAPRSPEERESALAILDKVRDILLTLEV